MMAINIAEGPAEKKKTISAASGQQSSRSLKSSEKTRNQRRQGTRHRITFPFLDHVHRFKMERNHNLQMIFSMGISWNPNFDMISQ